MMNTDAYILARALISPQKPFDDSWMDTPEELPHGSAAECIDPDFRQYIPPAVSRRLPLMLKRAVTLAHKVLRDAGCPCPDAIITATGTGTIRCSENFLLEVGRTAEQSPAPTQFISSTHNSAGSAVAMALGCRGYNSTWSHGPVSFASALADTLIQIGQGTGTVLLSSHDEYTDNYRSLMKAAGCIPEDAAACDHSAAFLVGAAPSAVRIAGVRIFHPERFREALGSLCADTGVPRTVFCHDSALAGTLLPGARCLCLRDVFGYSFSYPAVCVYAAAACLEKGRLPRGCAGECPESILVYDSSNGTQHSMVLLTRQASC